MATRPRLVAGAADIPFRPDVLDAYLSDRVTQLLNRILKHNFYQNRIPPFISVGDCVL
jgi:hypothetical protein